MPATFAETRTQTKAANITNLAHRPSPIRSIGHDDHRPAAIRMGSQGQAATNGRVDANDDDDTGVRPTTQAAAPAHFVFVPLMAQGHLIPAIDTALLLATHGAVCTIVATPATAARVRPAIESAGRHSPSALSVRLVEFPLDYAAAGIPDGADNMDNLQIEYTQSYFDAVALLRAPVERYLRAHAPPFPTCVVADFCQPWATELAAGLGVPRLTFFSMCAFCLLCQHNVERFDSFAGVEDDDEPVVVPGLPALAADAEKKFTVTRAQAPGFFRGIPVPWFEDFADYIERARAEADGVIMNTFEEMEPEFVAGYAAARGMKVWTVGPVSLYHDHDVVGQRGASATTLAARGNTADIDADECLQWLDGKPAGSVVYVSFGSIAQAGAKQAVELGLGLEASGHPFIWVVRNAGDYDAAVREFLDELEARVTVAGGGGRGLLVRGWAPQVLILSHAAVGAFVTHCGWNSTLEAVTAGLPLVTWPHFSDQFLNEKMAVEVLGIGVSVGVTEPLVYQKVEKEIVVGRGVVEEAVRSVMGAGEEAEERRRRARALAVKARAAMQEGGSSHRNLVDLVGRFEGVRADSTKGA